MGSHLVDHLVEDRNCRVLVVDNLVAGRREFVHPKAEFYHHDITGLEEYLRKLFVQQKVRFVLNYAAHPYVPFSFERPLHVFDVNAAGAIKVINAAQEAGVEAILQVSSAELYGGNEIGKDIPVENRSKERGEDSWYINENHNVCPHSTYGVAKAAVDYYCQAAWRERKTPVITLRQFNCIGDRETHPYIVPEVIRQVSQFYPCCEGVRRVEGTCGDRTTLVGGMCPVHGSTTNSRTIKLGNNSFRDFLYAGDAVRIAVELLERGEYGEVYNLGSETGIKMYDLARLIGKLMGFEDVKVEVDEARKRPWEIWSLLADTTKIRRTIRGDREGFWKSTPLEEALKRTIAYYESNGRRWVWEK